MFKQIKINLDNEYSIDAVYEAVDIAIRIWKGLTPIGKARLTTDHVDVT